MRAINPQKPQVNVNLFPSDQLFHKPKADTREPHAYYNTKHRTLKDINFHSQQVEGPDLTPFVLATTLFSKSTVRRLNTSSH